MRIFLIYMGTKQGIDQVMPAGYRFVPTDQELVFHYLKKKDSRKPLPAQCIMEMDAISFYNQPPMILVGADLSRKKEWYFFVRGHEYYHGEKKKKQVVGNVSGFWRSIGEEDPIYNSNGAVFAFKIYFTYFSGTLQKAKRTHWSMELYRLPVKCDAKLQRDKWVLGRIRRGQDYNSCL
ncbi:Protein FEZ like [Actinidia chinensis var. chinensis]|uniref:Protein FEZ like n=1 Tax=Actinidia chinensis var. chinensis TaxID=1590841 RepID=A0A2R6PU37_ACTCC|nr:Protein FEZ like [Actinidia chinensis var. chinensis]